MNSGRSTWVPRKPGKRNSSSQSANRLKRQSGVSTQRRLVPSTIRRAHMKNGAGWNTLAKSDRSVGEVPCTGNPLLAKFSRTKTFTKSSESMKNAFRSQQFSVNRQLVTPDNHTQTNRNRTPFPQVGMGRCVFSGIGGESATRGICDVSNSFAIATLKRSSRNIRGILKDMPEPRSYPNPER